MLIISCNFYHIASNKIWLAHLHTLQKWTLVHAGNFAHGLCLLFILTRKVDSVLQHRVRIEVQENQDPCGVESMFVANRQRCFYYLAPCHGPAVGSKAVACSLLNLFILCKLLAVVNLCEEEGMWEETCNCVLAKAVDLWWDYFHKWYHRPAQLHSHSNKLFLVNSRLHLPLESLSPSSNKESVGNLLLF